MTIEEYKKTKPFEEEVSRAMNSTVEKLKTFIKIEKTWDQKNHYIEAIDRCIAIWEEAIKRKTE